MTGPGGWSVVSTDHLDRDAQQAVRQLNHDVEAVDGAPPLNEDALLRLTSVADQRHHRVIGHTGALLGYAQLRQAQSAAAAADIAVAPDTATGRGDVCAALFGAVEQWTAGDLLVWSHGDSSPVGDTARERGYQEDRVLLVMARTPTPSDTEPLPPPPSGVEIRAFVPGADDADWLGVNRRAFADHPEQGHWGPTELADRLAQPWFDPAGFFLAVDPAGVLLGFHWTKIEEGPVPGEPPVGEVYVIALDPSAQGRGLGGLLLRVGLSHLARRGVSTVLLYTDESNRGAVALYLRTGFEVTRREVQFRRRA